MPSKWDRTRGTFGRIHSDLFDSTPYDCEFFNYSAGTYDPAEGEITGQTRSSIGTIQVEIVPPTMDTSVENEGTSLDWDTSIRFPESDKPGDLVPLGVDNDRPTEIEITDPEENTTDTFELHGYTYEKGSGMFMCRLVEQ